MKPGVVLISGLVTWLLCAGCAVTPTIYPTASDMGRIRAQSPSEDEAYRIAFNRYGIESGWMFDRIADSRGLGRMDRTAGYIEKAGLHQVAQETRMSTLDFLTMGVGYVGMGLLVAAFSDGNGALAPIGLGTLVLGLTTFSFRDTTKRKKAAIEYNKWLRKQIEIQQ